MPIHLEQLDADRVYTQASSVQLAENSQNFVTETGVGVARVPSSDIHPTSIMRQAHQNNWEEKKKKGETQLQKKSKELDRLENQAGMEHI